MTTYNHGDVILVPFPFSNQSATKKRPAVVISSNAYNIEVKLILKKLGTLRPTDLSSMNFFITKLLGL